MAKAKKNVIRPTKAEKEAYQEYLNICATCESIEPRPIKDWVVYRREVRSRKAKAK